ncbi:NAD(P)H-dependent oxidoreductase [Ramlibacter sp. USB13]|uniref:FMN dependent NADH:quinone oxidoreductase n=1 Tax=Ramlibacter cellulosilyticus TaxID=2764187 RepID=A0A923SD27_9BURK|nr:NAD(P)H-dependent oxidoreductase [Ramlibacter cellulosilyticus]MBC5785484.1 NAD(P)H-dependent oxidoreductase [Ramlibacter cellulosilyticus]
MKLLHIDSSPLGAQSVSRELTRRVVAEWKANHAGTTVEYLDLAADAPSHLDIDSLGFRLGLDADSLTDAQKRENALTERLLNQFLAADVVVVGAPMYNFSIPSQLKAWIDRIAQAGRTFKYTEQGPVGLAGGKTVIVASSRGGAYAGNPALAFLDHQESYLKAIFGFFGITDVRFVRAEGVAMGEAAKAQALAAADAEIQAHTAEAANEAKAAIRA